MLPLTPRRRALLVTLPLAATTLPALAQTTAETAPPPAPAASAPSAPPAAPPAPPTQLQRVEIIQQRSNELRDRRESTAAKIVIGREEIERHGDSTLGEVLKRLPGVTTGGGPGRGGAPRMRGLGSGYTLILLDGQRVPPGFSIESIEPEQVERIEVLRAPTAETGARAIAGVINIVTREGFRRRLNNLRLGTGVENGNLQPAISWTRNDTAGDWIYNYSLSAARRESDTETLTTVERPGETQRETSWTRDQRDSLHANGRLQWRGAQGRSAMLQPLVVYSEGSSERGSRLDQIGGTAPYASTDGSGRGSFGLVRLNGEWRQPLSEGTRLELKTGIGRHESETEGTRRERDAAGGVLRTRSDRTDVADTSFHLNGKLNSLLANDHNLVTGLELETNRREDAGRTLYDGAPLLTDAGDNLNARTLRLAAYAQDEWTISPQWSAHAGLRWEGIRVRSDDFDTGGAVLGSVSNQSSVWSPLLHAVWKPDPKAQGQVRMSLTRTYRSPQLQNLIARPSINGRAPVGDAVSGWLPNDETTPDRVGNPGLKPELATGLDVAFEHYTTKGGLLSANVFHRHISHYMRRVTSLQTVNYSGVQRYVSRTENVGSAITQGIELEARFRLSDVVAEAPRVDVRLNASVFHSRVKGVPGPDNRIDQQPDGTANVGLDYKLPALPLAIGGNLNVTPRYTTRLTEEQWADTDRKVVGDAYLLWTLNPNAQLRFSASNFAPRDYTTVSRYDTSRTTTTQPSYVNYQLRLEMKL